MRRGSSRSDHGPTVRRLALTFVIASSTAVLAGSKHSKPIIFNPTTLFRRV